MKTNKSYTKRLRVSKNGTIVARTPGHNHFNAKRPSGEKRHNARSQDIEMSNQDRSRFLP
jgi:ribosomal protein L35